ncbi:MAG: alpha/beta fold hydrolase [Alphaproteobacteria bacterium]|nr:alpha/beta fold hydrolase [Alphaproteobacteria bacterium]
MIETLPESIRALYPFKPNWVKSGNYRLHYVDEGPRRPDAVVLPHGNPTWGFLYRNIVPPLVAAGHRVIVPDHLGSGRSDHAIHEGEYAIAHHAARLRQILETAGVERAVFFLQDWGGPISFGACLAKPGLLAGMVLGNTFWGAASDFHRRVYPWRGLHAPIAGPLLFGRRRVFIDGAKLGMPKSSHEGAVWAGFRLPFDITPGPGATLAWPRAISLGPGHPTQPLADAIWAAMPQMDVPTRFVWGASDPVFPWEEQGLAMQARLPRAREHAPTIVKEARHFVQEWAPRQCADALLAVAEEAFSRKVSHGR